MECRTYILTNLATNRYDRQALLADCFSLPTLLGTHHLDEGVLIATFLSTTAS